MPTNGNGNSHDPCPPLDRYRQHINRFRDCSPGQMETTVDFTGTQGDPGRTGAQGPPGLTGPPGPKGDSALTYTACDFIMPAVDDTVIVIVDNAKIFSPGLPVFIQGAGYFLIENVDYQINNLSLLNIEAPPTQNAAPGTKILTGSLTMPTGPAGLVGTPGQPSWTQTIADFIVPQPGQSIFVSVENTDWMVPGAQLWVKGANSATKGGAFRIGQILDRHTVELINSAT